MLALFKLARERKRGEKKRREGERKKRKGIEKSPPRWGKLSLGCFLFAGRVIETSRGDFLIRIRGEILARAVAIISRETC